MSAIATPIDHTTAACLAAGSRRVVPGGVSRAEHRNASPPSVTPKVTRRSSEVAEKCSVSEEKQREQVREELALLMKQAVQPVAIDKGVKAAWYALGGLLGWDVGKVKRHYYGEVQKVAAHDYLHAQRVILEKRRRLEQAQKDLDAALAAINRSWAEGD
jgi:hypothetical protein